jgi:phage tail-like protein
MSGERPFLAFRFDVQISVPGVLGLPNPLCNAAFAECDGLEMTMEPKTVREGGNNTQQIHLVGPVSYGTLSLKRGMTSNIDLWKWFTQSVSGDTRSAQAEVVIIMRNGQGAEQVRFKVHNCLPLKMKAPALNAKEGLLAIEEMQLAYRYFEIEEPQSPFGLSAGIGFSASGGVSAGAGFSASASASFGFG